MQKGTRKVRDTFFDSATVKSITYLIKRSTLIFMIGFFFTFNLYALELSEHQEMNHCERLWKFRVENTKKGQIFKYLVREKRQYKDGDAYTREYFTVNTIISSSEDCIIEESKDIDGDKVTSKYKSTTLKADYIQVCGKNYVTRKILERGITSVSVPAGVFLTNFEKTESTLSNGEFTGSHWETIINNVDYTIKSDYAQTFNDEHTPFTLYTTRELAYYKL